MQNIVTSRFVLQAFLDELLEFDRDIPVARNVQVGDVADAVEHVLHLMEPGSIMSDDRLPSLQPEP